ncbi:MAG: hypothetical protein IPJ61_06880 [Tessaracoccus sp.]|nr:hypothetical protein [Tessaracoccus sp.]
MVGTVWATCGHKWGFRFLLDGGLGDPLAIYERAFAGAENEATFYRRTGNHLALRILDPLGRQDSAGRIIQHDFVVWGASAANIGTLEDGTQRIWPLVADAYASLWLSQRPPTHAEIRAAFDD